MPAARSDAALFVWYQLLDHPRERPDGSRLAAKELPWARGFTPDEVETNPWRRKASPGYSGSQTTASWPNMSPGCSPTARFVGWFQGRMEFGPQGLERAASSAIPARPPCRRP